MRGRGGGGHVKDGTLWNRYGKEGEEGSEGARTMGLGGEIHLDELGRDGVQGRAPRAGQRGKTQVEESVDPGIESLPILPGPTKCHRGKPTSRHNDVIEERLTRVHDGDAGSELGQRAAGGEIWRHAIDCSGLSIRVDKLCELHKCAGPVVAGVPQHKRVRIDDERLLAFMLHEVMAERLAVCIHMHGHAW
jgi:hypothetical protein